MNSKIIYWNAIWMYTIVLFMALVSCDSKKNKEAADGSYYTCPMHPEIKKNAPGACPICKMDLVKTAGKPVLTEEKASDSLNVASVNSTVLSGIKGIKPIRKSLPFKIKTSGYISYDTRRIHTISSRIPGRLEKLHIKFNFQEVHKGQALFEVFSAELLAAQNDYLYVKNNDPDPSMIASSKRRLILLGMSERQVNNLKMESHQNSRTTVYSPYSGYVVDNLPKDNIAKNDEGMGSASMQKSTVPQNISMDLKSNVTIREGAYVSKGEPIFKVVNTDVVWAILEIYSDAISYIRPNQKVHLVLENTDMKIMGKVDFIEPSFKVGKGTTRLRIHLDNKNQNLKIGNLISGEIDIGQQEGLWIPQAATYDLGLERIVFIKDGGSFKTRRIITGITSGNEVSVTSGLKEDELIAENAQFMIDSESFVK